MRTIELHGSYVEMGEQYGEAVRHDLAVLAEARFGIIMTEVQRLAPKMTKVEVVAVLHSLSDAVFAQLPTVGEELLAISRSSKVSLPLLIAAGGYTDAVDAVLCTRTTPGSATADECTTIVLGRSEPTGAIVAGSWDSHASAERFLTLVKRKPRNAPECIALTTVGWPVQQGVNEAGIAFATNNMVPNRAGVGVVYIAALAAIASCTSLEEVDALFREMRFSSGHYYPICNSTGAIRGYETNHSCFRDLASGLPFLAHTNHYLCPIMAEDSIEPSSSSLHRLQRVEDLWLNSNRDVGAIWSLLSDHSGNSDAICRHGYAREKRSCAGFVLHAKSRAIEFRAGPPCQGKTQYLKL
jgi:hypothetical protein